MNIAKEAELMHGIIDGFIELSRMSGRTLGEEVSSCLRGLQASGAATLTGASMDLSEEMDDSTESE